MNWHNSVTKQLKIIKEHFVCFYINTSVGLPTSIHSPAVICSPSSCTRAVKQRAVKSLRAILLVNRSSLVLVCHLQLFYPALIIPGDSRYLGCSCDTLPYIFVCRGSVNSNFYKAQKQAQSLCWMLPCSSFLEPVPWLIPTFQETLLRPYPVLPLSFSIQKNNYSYGTSLKFDSKISTSMILSENWF